MEIQHVNIDGTEEYKINNTFKKWQTMKPSQGDDRRWWSVIRFVHNFSTHNLPFFIYRLNDVAIAMKSASFSHISNEAYAQSTHDLFHISMISGSRDLNDVQRCKPRPYRNSNN